MIGRITVWLDHLAPAGGSFAQGLDWAGRLHLPLHGVLLRESCRSWEKCRPQRDHELLDSCSAQCGGLGVSWEATVCEETPTLAAVQLVRPNELCVFSQAVSPVLWDVLLHWTLSSPETISLVCPENSPRLERVLIVNEDNGPESKFLLSAAQICKRLAASPIVLTADRQEREARRRELLAEEIFARQEVAADFDLIACADIRQAVVLATRCRGCTHVFVERRHAAPWWHWLRGQTLQRLLGLSESLTFLTYSGTGLIPLSEEAVDKVDKQRTELSLLSGKA